MLPRARTPKSPIRVPKLGNELFACVCRSSYFGLTFQRQCRRQALNTITLVDLWNTLTTFTVRYFVTKGSINQSLVFRYSEDQAGFLQGRPPMCATP